VVLFDKVIHRFEREVEMPDLQVLSDNWAGLFIIAVSVVMISLAVPHLLILGLHGERLFSNKNLLLRAEVALATSSGTCLVLAIIDILFLHTVVATFAAVLLAAFNATVIGCYLYLVARYRYGLTAYINNGH
jgi:hypothetical protein